MLSPLFYILSNLLYLFNKLFSLVDKYYFWTSFPRYHSLKLDNSLIYLLDVDCNVNYPFMTYKRGILNIDLFLRVRVEKINSNTTSSIDRVILFFYFIFFISSFFFVILTDERLLYQLTCHTGLLRCFVDTPYDLLKPFLRPI